MLPSNPEPPEPSVYHPNSEPDTAQSPLPPQEMLPSDDLQLFLLSCKGEAMHSARHKARGAMVADQDILSPVTITASEYTARRPAAPPLLGAPRASAPPHSSRRRRQRRRQCRRKRSAGAKAHAQAPHASDRGPKGPCSLMTIGSVQEHVNALISIHVYI